VVVELAFDATVVLVLAWILAFVLARVSAAVRHRVWALAIAGLLALPLLWCLLPEVSVGSSCEHPPRRSATVTEVAVVEPTPQVSSGHATESVELVPNPFSAGLATEEPVDTAPQDEMSLTVLPAEAATDSQSESPRNAAAVPGPTRAAVNRFDWRSLLAAAWAVGLTVGLISLASSIVASRRLVRAAVTPADALWRSACRKLTDRLGIKRPVTVVASGRTEVPSTVGWLRPVVVLPVSCQEWSAERWRVVLAHELTHVARCDVVWQIATRVACAMYWFHPLIWAAARRLRMEQETACDDTVLRLGERPSSYASHLLELAEAISGRRPASMAAAMAGTHAVEKRIRLILHPNARRAPIGRRAAGLLLAAVATVSLVTGLITPLDTPAAPADAPATDVSERKAESDAKTDSSKDTKSAPDAKAATELPDQNSEQPSARQGPLRLFDGFDEKLALEWKVVRHDPTHVSLEMRPGYFTLTTQTGDIRDHWNRAKNLHLVDNPIPDGGDFVMTTCLDSFKPISPWHQAGLLLYDDDDNFIKLVFEFSHVGYRILDFSREENRVGPGRRIPFDPDSERIWLRLTKRGKLYEPASSTDGVSYEVYGVFPWADGFPKQMGLSAMNGGSAMPLEAHFDFFEVRPLTEQEKNVPRLVEREKLHGTWRATSCQLSGKPLDKAPLSRFDFGSNTVVVTEGEKTFAAEYSVDLTKQPRQFTLWNEVSRSTVLLRFIYELEGDTLTLGFNPAPDESPPATFETKEGDGFLVAKLQRVSEAEVEVLPTVRGSGSPWTPQRRFSRLDADRNEFLTLDEFTAEAAAPEAVKTSQEFYKECDQNSNGELSFEELRTNNQKATFWAMDRDGDMALSLKEFSGSEMNKASLAKARSLFDLMDVDDDKAIRFDEYRRRPQDAWFAKLDANESDQVSLGEWGASNAALVRDGRAKPYFAAVDLDGDGLLSLDEFTKKSQEAQFIKRDTDADGKLNVDEFVSWMPSPEKKAAGRELFAKKDKNGDGLLSFRESAFRPVDDDFWNADQDENSRLSIDEYKAAHPSLGDDAVKAAFEAADQNGDSEINLAEFQSADK